MSDSPPGNDLESLLRAARADEPDELPTERARELVARARAKAEARRRQRHTAVGFALAAAAMFALGIFGARALLRPHAEQTTVALEDRTVAGDRITHDEGARYALASDTPGLRRVELERGTVLCDVRPLGADTAFEVDAGPTTVRVRGTVFSVTRTEHTVVRVYEGRVEVEHEGRTFELTRDERWSSDESRARAIDVGPLAAEGERAADARASHTPNATPSLVPSAPLPSTVPSAPAAAESASSAASSDAPVVREAPPVPSTRGSTSVASTSAEESARTRAERALRAGDPRTALELARAARSRGDADADWSMVEADALRALAQDSEAADAYDAIARLDSSHRGEAAYAAAMLRLRRLHDPDAALRSLDAARTVDSPLGERVLSLRVRLLITLGRRDEARVEAGRYLERYEDGGSADAMRALLRE